MRIVFCIWSAMLVLGLSCAHAQEPLTLCSADSPPWTIKTGRAPSDITGLAVDIMNELFSRAGSPVEMVALPFKRCLDNTKSGALDGCFMTIKNAEREQYAEFTDSYLSIPTFVYYSAEKLGHFEWNAWEDLVPYRIGVQRGFKYGRDFSKALTELPLKIVEVSDVAEGVGMVLLDRVDLMLINEFRFNYLTRTHPEFADKLHRAQKPVAVGRVYIAISKRSPHVSMVPELNEFIAEMIADGTMKKIVQTPVDSNFRK